MQELLFPVSVPRPHPCLAWVPRPGKAAWRKAPEAISSDPPLGNAGQTEARVRRDLSMGSQLGPEPTWGGSGL